MSERVTHKIYPVKKEMDLLRFSPKNSKPLRGARNRVFHQAEGLLKSPAACGKPVTPIPGMIKIISKPPRLSDKKKAPIGGSVFT